MLLNSMPLNMPPLPLVADARVTLEELATAVGKLSR